MDKIKSLQIIYEDNHVITVNKPAGLLVQSDITKKVCLMDLVKDYLKEKYHKPGNVFLGLVHRLDQPVSGIMVFARTSKAASRLSAQIREHQVRKIYQALVYGKIKKKKGILIDYLKKDANKNIVQISPSFKDGFLRAELNYQVIEEFSDTTLVEIQLKTGRSHQIRAQFSSLGHPVLGDKKYGRKDKFKNIALQAVEFQFIHPTTKKVIDLKIPSNFRDYGDK
jgi:23S rRNA pseudouridine1911/1915/1917 synthase